MDEIRVCLDTYYALFRSRDWHALSLLMTDDFRLFSDNASDMDKVAFLSFIKDSKWIVSTIEISCFECHASHLMAMARYHILFSGIENNKNATIEAVETMFFIKDHQGWKVSHSHVSNKN